MLRGTSAGRRPSNRFEGRRPAEVPRNMASLWADYTFHETALSGLTLGAGARYIGNTVPQ